MALPPARKGVPIWVVSLLLVVVTKVQPPDIAFRYLVSATGWGYIGIASGSAPAVSYVCFHAGISLNQIAEARRSSFALLFWAMNAASRS